MARPRKYKINDDFFKEVNTEEKAYFLGLMYADGYNGLKNGKFKLSLQNGDIDILEKFKKALSFEGPIHLDKIIGDRKPIVSLHISNKTICRHLDTLGCFQKKSLTLKFPTEKQVPRMLIRHFIRGYFDGDGGAYLLKSSISLQITSTFEFCNQLSVLTKEKRRIIDTIYIKILKNGITSRFEISKKIQVIDFLDWIYRDSIVHLDRKYQKYLNILKKYTKRKAG